jgi:hypothetical protein
MDSNEQDFHHRWTCDPLYKDPADQSIPYIYAHTLWDFKMGGALQSIATALVTARSGAWAKREPRIWGELHLPEVSCREHNDRTADSISTTSPQSYKIPNSQTSSASKYGW